MCSRWDPPGSVTGGVDQRSATAASTSPASRRTTAEQAARRLSSLIDPEDHDGGFVAVPSSIPLSELLVEGRPDPQAIARRWEAAGPDPAPVATIGWSGDGTVDVDLVRDGPHGLIAGTTGSGKSELLRTLVVAMAAEVSPDAPELRTRRLQGGRHVRHLRSAPSRRRRRHRPGAGPRRTRPRAVSTPRSVGANDCCGPHTPTISPPTAATPSIRWPGWSSSSTSSLRSRRSCPTSCLRSSASRSGVAASASTCCWRPSVRRAW